VVIVQSQEFQKLSTVRSSIIRGLVSIRHQDFAGSELELTIPAVTSPHQKSKVFLQNV